MASKPWSKEELALLIAHVNSLNTPGDVEMLSKKYSRRSSDDIQGLLAHYGNELRSLDVDSLVQVINGKQPTAAARAASKRKASPQQSVTKRAKGLDGQARPSADASPDSDSNGPDLLTAVSTLEALRRGKGSVSTAGSAAASVLAAQSGRKPTSPLGAGAMPSPQRRPRIARPIPTSAASHHHDSSPNRPAPTSARSAALSPLATSASATGIAASPMSSRKRLEFDDKTGSPKQSKKISSTSRSKHGDSATASPAGKRARATTASSDTSQQPGLSSAPAGKVVTPIMQAMGEQLSHCVKNPRALRWAMAEFFYSATDRALLSDNTFERTLEEVFPAVGLAPVTRGQWRLMRLRLPKPRRFSPHFVKQQRDILHDRREVVRKLHQGDPTAAQGIHLPDTLPMPHCVGDLVLARASNYNGLISPGLILAILPHENAYRIDFFREPLGIQTIPDYMVAPSTPPPTASLAMLTKEKIFVPSAGVADTPRSRRTRSSPASPTPSSPFLSPSPSPAPSPFIGAELGSGQGSAPAGPMVEAVRTDPMAAAAVGYDVGTFVGSKAGIGTAYDHIQLIKLGLDDGGDSDKLGSTNKNISMKVESFLNECLAFADSLVEPGSPASKAIADARTPPTRDGLASSDATATAGPNSASSSPSKAGSSRHAAWYPRDIRLLVLLRICGCVQLALTQALAHLVEDELTNRAALEEARVAAENSGQSSRPHMNSSSAANVASAAAPANASSSAAAGTPSSNEPQPKDGRTDNLPKFGTRADVQWTTQALKRSMSVRRALAASVEDRCRRRPAEAGYVALPNVVAMVTDLENAIQQRATHAAQTLRRPSASSPAHALGQPDTPVSPTQKQPHIQQGSARVNTAVGPLLEILAFLERCLMNPTPRFAIVRALQSMQSRIRDMYDDEESGRRLMAHLIQLRDIFLA